MKLSPTGLFFRKSPTSEKLRTKGLDGSKFHQRFLEMAYVGEDQAAISREIQWFAGKPEEYLSFGLQAANRNVLASVVSRAGCTNGTGEEARR
jgi:hypothetical protein